MNSPSDPKTTGREEEQCKSETDVWGGIEQADSSEEATLLLQEDMDGEPSVSIRRHFGGGNPPLSKSVEDAAEVPLVKPACRRYNLTPLVKPREHDNIKIHPRAYIIKPVEPVREVVPPNWDAIHFPKSKPDQVMLPATKETDAIPSPESKHVEEKPEQAPAQTSNQDSAECVVVQDASRICVPDSISHRASLFVHDRAEKDKYAKDDLLSAAHKFALSEFEGTIDGSKLMSRSGTAAWSIYRPRPMSPVFPDEVRVRRPWLRQYQASLIGFRTDQFAHSLFDAKGIIHNVNNAICMADRNAYFTDIFFQKRYFSATSHVDRQVTFYSPNSLLESWNQFVYNYNISPNTWMESLLKVKQNFLAYSLEGAKMSVHLQCREEEYDCAVTNEQDCPMCYKGDPKMPYIMRRGVIDGFLERKQRAPSNKLKVLIMNLDTMFMLSHPPSMELVGDGEDIIDSLTRDEETNRAQLTATQANLKASQLALTCKKMEAQINILLKWKQEAEETLSVVRERKRKG